MSWDNPVPVAVGLIRVFSPEQGLLGLLAGRRTIQPCIGEWGLPAGYVNKLESAETAVAREVFEETGFDFPQHLWTPFATRITERNRILVFHVCKEFLLESDLCKFVPNSECDAVKIVSPAEEPQLCFTTHEEMLQKAHIWNTEWWLAL